MLTKNLAIQLIESDNEYPVSFDDAWQWIGYSRKDSAKRNLIDSFTSEIDFHIIVEPITTGIQANPRENIFLTIDCFKSMAMMAGTAKGKEVRQYFIECERQLKQQQYKIPKTYAEALLEAGRLAKIVEQQDKRILEQDAQLEEQKPKVALANAIAFSDTSIDFNCYAKLIGTGRNKMMNKLRDIGVLMKNSTLPYQKWMDAGYFEVSQEIKDNGRLVPYALVTGKGQVWLKQRIDHYDNLAKKAIASISQGVIDMSI